MMWTGYIYRCLPLDWSWGQSHGLATICHFDYEMEMEDKNWTRLSGVVCPAVMAVPPLSMKLYSVWILKANSYSTVLHLYVFRFSWFCRKEMSLSGHVYSLALKMIFRYVSLGLSPPGLSPSLSMGQLFFNPLIFFFFNHKAFSSASGNGTILC